MESWLFRFLLTVGACMIVGLCAAAQDAPPPSRGFLLVANKGEHTLGIIDPIQGQQIAKVEEGGVTGPSFPSTETPAWACPEPTGTPWR